MQNLLKPLKSKRGEGYIDTVVLVLCAMLVIALAVRVFPAYIAKQKVDTFATEILRVAEITGRIGSETSAEERRLKAELGINPNVSWSEHGNIQLNKEVTVTVTLDVEIGLFGDFGSFNIPLRAVATGRSEVYWK